MAGTQDLDTATAVLTAAREQTQTVDLAEIRRFELAVDWAAMHSTDTLAGEWEGELSLAGEGAPEVAEFCIAEFALAIGKSTDAGRRYLGDAIEVRYRLPRIWKLVTTGKLSVWKACRIAQATVLLPMEGAAYVDRHVAPTAARISFAQLDRTIDDAQARFDPAAAEERRIAAAESRHLDVHTHQVSFDGTVHIDGELDLVDALDFEDVIAAGAQQLADLGCTESLDVRRSMAVGALARGQAMLPVVEEVALQPSRNPRQIVLNVHTDGGPFAHVEHTRRLHSLEQVRDWCGNPSASVHVRQVIDLNEHRWTDQHDPTPLLREQVLLTHATCVFPQCARRSRSCDVDHIIDWPLGPTCSCNLAPLCRGHHRLKTHARWTYIRTGPTTFIWTSPHGHTYTVESQRHI